VNRENAAVYHGKQPRPEFSEAYRAVRGDRTTQPGDTGVSSRHPCQYSPEVLAVLAELIEPGDHVHDPFAGPGIRLGPLCDQIGATFSGCEIESPPWEWEPPDPRVRTNTDSRDPDTYPVTPYLLVVSTVYLNKRCADYPNGATPATRTKGRRDYGITLGRALSRANLARFTGPGRRKALRYWEEHAAAVKHWGDRVIVNVDQPISTPDADPERWSKFGDWQTLLETYGYTVTDKVPIKTRRYGGLDNADKRADHEVIIIARRIKPG
jgi:hypothetical protein